MNGNDERISSHAVCSEKHIVFLVHGIRSHAEWQHHVEDVFRRNGIEAVPLSYGYLDIFNFLLPRGYLKDSISKRIERMMRLKMAENRNAKVSVLAHSFGTYIISHILASEPDIHFYRVMFCGSIVRQDYRWDLVQTRILAEGKKIINDCGVKDLWAILAQCISSKYGWSGRYGFGNPVVMDRFHQGGHGLFFEGDFFERYWIDFIKNGTVARNDVPENKTAWYFKVLAFISFGWYGLVAVLCSLFFIFDVPGTIVSMNDRVAGVTKYSLNINASKVSVPGIFDLYKKELVLAGPNQNYVLNNKSNHKNVARLIESLGSEKRVRILISNFNNDSLRNTYNALFDSFDREKGEISETINNLDEIIKNKLGGDEQKLKEIKEKRWLEIRSTDVFINSFCFIDGETEEGIGYFMLINKRSSGSNRPVHHMDREKNNDMFGTYYNYIVKDLYGDATVLWPK